MRVALIGHTYIAAANRGKLGYLVDACDDFLLVSPETWPEPNFEVRRYAPDDGLNAVAFATRHAGHVRRYTFPHDELKRALESFRPDVVHVEAETGSLVALQSIRIARRLRAGVTQFRWENIPSERGWRRVLMAWNFRRLDHLFCGSKDALDAARAEGYRGPGSVVPQLGTAPRPAGEKRRLFPDGVFVVGFVARLEAKKGAADLLQAVGRLASERVGVVVVGDGPEREALEQRARELGIGERVRFTGTVAHEDVAPYMRGFDAFVLPSRDVPGWREQFGKVLVEAMVCGTPVVGSDAGAIPDVVGDAGLIFPQGDVERLAAMLTELLENSALRQRLSEAGPRRAAERFTDEAAARPLVATWRELTGRP